MGGAELGPWNPYDFTTCTTGRPHPRRAYPSAQSATDASAIGSIGRRHSARATKPATGAASPRSTTAATSQDPTPPSGSSPNTASSQSGHISVIAASATVATAKVDSTQNRRRTLTDPGESSGTCAIRAPLTLTPLQLLGLVGPNAAKLAVGARRGRKEGPWPLRRAYWLRTSAGKRSE